MVVIGLQRLLMRLTGSRLPLPRPGELTPDGVQGLVPFREPVPSVLTPLIVRHCLEQQVREIEHRVGRPVVPSPAIRSCRPSRAWGLSGVDDSPGSRRHATVPDGRARRCLLAVCRQ